MNRIRFALEYILFRLRYPSPVKFVRVTKMMGTFYSQAGQDLFISGILFNQLNQESNQLIIDIGANHPTKYSNSYFFEKYFACKTLAIDPLHEFKELWDAYRPSAEFLSVALGSKDDFLNITIPIAGDNMLSSLEEGGVMKTFHKGRFEVRKVRVTTLRQVLEDRRITDVLLMSIDVEGFELEVLKGIDFDKVKFKVIICENNSNKSFGSDEIRNFLIQKNYIYYARIGRLDDLFISPSMHGEMNLH
jgi:FkbM family methyltransferase